MAADQLSLLDLLDDATHERIWCRYCHSNWGHGLKPEVLERLAIEHREAEPGRCAHMVERGTTEPYYRTTDTPWRSGWAMPERMPEGYRGLEQARGVTP